MAKYRVDVYESRDDIFNDDGIMGMDFEFPDYDHMTKFVEQMVVQHGKTVIVTQNTEK